MFEELHNYRKQRAWLRRLASPVFIIALLVGVVLHFIGFLIFRVKTSPLPVTETKLPFVNYVAPEVLARDAELEEQSVLFDSAPLFIPTQWSATRRPVLMGRDSAGDGFVEFAPQIDLKSELRLSGITQVEAGSVREPVDLLSLRFWDLFRDFGRSSSEPQPFESEGASARVQVLEHASAVGSADSKPLVLDVPVDVLAGGLLARPARMLLLVSAAGRILGGPTLMQSSGDAAFDQAILDWVQQSDVAVRLPVGYLEIEVYP